MEESTPTVTAIITTFNRKNYCKEAIKSVLAQTYTDFELLVLDNSSSDGTETMVESFDDPRVHYICHPNLNIAEARNLGWQRAKGAYVAYLDDDDTWLPNKLMAEIEVFNRGDDDLALVYGSFLKVNSNGESLGEHHPVLHGKILKDLLDQKDAFTGSASNPLIRKNALVKLDGYNNKIVTGEDWELYLRLAERYTIEYTKEIVLHIRQHEGPRLGDKLKDAADLELLVLNLYEDIFNNFPKLKSFYLQKVGGKLVRIGQKRNGRRYLKEAIRANPYNLFAYVQYLLSFANSETYRKFHRIYLERSNFKKNKGNKKTRFLIHFSNDTRLGKNLPFRDEKQPNFLSMFKKLKIYLSSLGIEIDTLDMDKIKNATHILYYNLPYPWQIKRWIDILPNRSKNILFLIEPSIINPFSYFKIFHVFFSRIFTWNIDLVDNKKYFDYRIGQSYYGIDTKAKSFQDKKFLTVVVGNKVMSRIKFFLSKFGIARHGEEIYSERIRALDYFEKNIPERFDLYGIGWNKKKYKTYRGIVDNKIEVLSRYKYCLCYENMSGIPGYITEKIFDCLKAKCVPVYLGASDIEKHIPENCFIDFRKFKSYNELIDYLEGLNEIEYETYVRNIEQLLKNETFMAKWFEDNWVKNFSKDLLRNVV